jgi:hypothetical protein
MNNLKEECIELKNIKYKTMMINGSQWNESKSSSDLTNLDIFLENEKNMNINEPWSKLDKTLKTKKLLVYAEIYKVEKNLDEKEYNSFIAFLKDCLDRKKLQRVKDITYDRTTGTVKDIPGLLHNKINNHFTIKNMDKRISTIKSIAPKRTTKKNLCENDLEEETC